MQDVVVRVVESARGGAVVAVVKNTIAQKIGRTFASEVAGRPSVAEIWVSTGRDGVHLWLFARDVDAEEERSLYRRLEVLDTRFGDVDFQLHILNPSSYSIALHDVLPKDAQKIFPHAA